MNQILDTFPNIAEDKPHFKIKDIRIIFPLFQKLIIKLIQANKNQSTDIFDVRLEILEYLVHNYFGKD